MKTSAATGQREVGEIGMRCTRKSKQKTDDKRLSVLHLDVALLSIREKYSLGIFFF
jgi:hypothetical protein